MKNVIEFKENMNNMLIFSDPKKVVDKHIIGLTIPEGKNFILEIKGLKEADGRKKARLEIDGEIFFDAKPILKKKGELSFLQVIATWFGKKYYSDELPQNTEFKDLYKLLSNANDYLANDINDYILFGTILEDKSMVFYAAFKRKPGLEYFKVPWHIFEDLGHHLEFTIPKKVLDRVPQARKVLVHACRNIITNQSFKKAKLEPFAFILLQSSSYGDNYASVYFEVE